jgi:trehalose utilization protein
VGEVEREYLWLVNPGHAIAAGIEYGFVIPQEEVYLEYFDIPQPDELVFISSFSGGEAFRSGCCFKRGAGKIFYFRPGHETCPTYHHAQVQRVLLNAVRWAAPTGKLAFEATHRGRDFLLDPRNPGDTRVVGASHALAEILDPEKYVR